MANAAHDARSIQAHPDEAVMLLGMAKEILDDNIHALALAYIQMALDALDVRDALDTRDAAKTVANTPATETDSD